MISDTLSEGDTIYVNARTAEERDLDWREVDSDVVKCRVDEIDRVPGTIDVFTEEEETTDIILFIEERDVITPYCEGCDGDKLYHEGKEKLFCPFCHDS